MESSTSDDSIKVIVRVRPPDQQVTGDVENSLCLEVHDARTILMHTKPEHRIFTFDHVAGMETTQEEIFNYVGRPTIETCMCGYNGTVFAYGQTGSGKTFTMIGPPDESDSFTHDLRGVIPRSFEYLFSLINREKQKHGDLVEFLCKSSFLEIYNEQVFDLLDTASSGLHLRESMKRGVYVDGLSEHIVTSAREAYQVLTKGWNNRRVASTSMNRESSRSHAVFTIMVESKKKESRDSVAKIRSSLLNLVDLAGSERQRDARTEGLRLKEAGNINRSLSALGNVILALVDIANGKQRHVPYRDSRLTFLLRDSLGGNAKTFLVANVHPNARCFGESLSTVNFARRAKMIKNKAVVNEDTSGNVLQLQAEIKKLKAALENARAGIAPEVPVSDACSDLESLSPNDGKAVRELKEILNNNIAARSKAESDKVALAERMDQLEEMLNKKEKFLQSTKMILKLREAHISNLEKARQDEGFPDLETETIRLLKDEINQLKYKVEHNPDVTKMTVENVDLKSEVKRLKSMMSGSPDLSRELAKAHQYSLQLERQLKPHLGVEGASDDKPVSEASLVSSASSEYNELQLKCRAYQEELTEAKKALEEEKEISKIQHVKLEANLTAAQRTNQELERTIAALKLKNSVERETLNDMHMKAIKSMMTPRREAKSPNATPSIGSTPQRAQSLDTDSYRRRASTLPFHRERTSVSSPEIPEESIVRHNSTSLVRVPRLLSRSYSDLSTHDVAVNTDISGDIMSNDQEYNIEGALADEVQLLQNAQQTLYHQIEEKENEIRRLKLEQLTSNLELKTLNELLQSERSQAHDQENVLVESMKELHTKVADLSGTNSMLNSEVTDLKACLQKQELQLHSKTQELKDALSKISSLEESITSLNTEYELNTQALQFLQDEVETMREELIFKEHCFAESEHNLTQEREHSTGLETEIQSLVEKLSLEVEKNNKLSVQLQEQGNKTNKELIAVLNDNAKMQTAYSELLSNFESQTEELSIIQKENKLAEETITSLKKSNANDQEAIASLMNNLVEYKATINSDQAKISNLNDELLEHEKELQNATAKIEELQAALVDSQNERDKLESLHIKQIKSRDLENDLLADDLEHLTQQFHQLSDAHSQIIEELRGLKEEVHILQQTLSDKDNEIAKLKEEAKTKIEELNAQVCAASESTSASIIESQQEEITKHPLKNSQSELFSMIEQFENSRQEKNKILQSKSMEHEALKQQYELLKTRHSTLQYQLDADKEESRLREINLEQKNAETLKELDLLRQNYENLIDERQSTGSEKMAKLEAMCEKQQAINQDLQEKMERTLALEAEHFNENAKLRSEYNTMLEERAKLLKEFEALTLENARLGGHQNLKQKIHYHLQVKIENSQLKEQNARLNAGLKQKAEHVKSLEGKLQELAKQLSNHQDKENLLPH